MEKVRGPSISLEELKSAKVRITTYLDKEVLDILRSLAIDSGSKYQALLNQILKDYLLGQKRGLVSRIARLEEAVFKKRAA
ncbi:MAG: BrnA antitoxin family protein [Deltaproteobacteria bacterium]|nr:BrnA antitoxin family protein [Deltaproteobacteria bacterium]